MYPSFHHPVVHGPDAPSNPSRAGDFVSAADAVSLLHLVATVGALRHDPASWRQELLKGLNRLLGHPAGISLALILRQDGDAPMVVSWFEAGLKDGPQREAFTREFNNAPLLDPLALRALQHFLTRRLAVFTCLRTDLVDDAAWDSDAHINLYRKPTGMGDCLLSLCRGPEKALYALYAFRPAVAAAPGTVNGAAVPACAHFGPRERLLLDTLHRGVEGLYRAEEAAHRFQSANTLRPRLRQTLDYLLAGDTERQIALKMSLSVHTVHGYVKALYAHFGVSKRSELVARWLHTTGQLPKQNP